MGFFSWLTADTEETVSNHYSIRGARPVYLLQPNGLEPILESNYEGYGRFGEIDAYHWLALANLDKAVIVKVESEIASGVRPVSEYMRGKPIQEIVEEAFRDIGCALDMFDYYRDVETGDLVTFFHRIPQEVQDKYGLKIRHHQVTYDVPLSEFDGQSPNELITSGRLAKIDLPRPEFPIKLSFDAKAVYEDLPESRNCPEQGYFYASEDDDDGGDDEIEEDPIEDDELDEAA